MTDIRKSDAQLDAEAAEPLEERNLDSAIVLQGDSSTVFVVGRDSVAHARTVVRGAHEEGRTEVRGNLAPGDRIVTTGAFGLQDGMRVAPSGGRSR